MMTFWTKLSRAVRAFRTARAGNVAITFALAILPIIGMVGYAVDYSRANSVKAAMQAAVDSTAMMLSREASGLSRDDLQTKAFNYFTAQFKRPYIINDVQHVTVRADYGTDGGSHVTLSASANVPTTFLGILGILGSGDFDHMTVTTSTVAKWGSSRLRVALVLDNTGSMNDNGKIDALKTATKQLLTQLHNAASVDGDVYVSIIPFVKDVSVDPKDYVAAWDDWIYWDDVAKSDPNSWDANNGTCTRTSRTTRSTCITSHSCTIAGYTTQTSCEAAGICSVSGYTDQTSCANAGICSLSGYTDQNSCTGAGTCSLSGPTTQNTCTAAGTCSISGPTTQNSCTSAGTCSLSGYTTQSTCTGAGTCSNPAKTTQSACTGQNACSNAQYTSRSPCQNNHFVWGLGTWTPHPGTWTAATWTPATWTAATWTATPGTWTLGAWVPATWTPANHSTWNGCFTDRGTSTAPGTTAGYDQDTTAPTTNTPATLFPAEQYGSCPHPMVGLNYNWTNMESIVDAMVAAGNTNQPIGLMWGWLSLVGGGPFSVPLMDSNYKYDQAIILLSDGLNTQDRWYSQSATSNPPRIDYRMLDPTGHGTCANINAAGITLYTIQVNTGGDATSTLLQNCAGSPGHFPDPDKFFLLTTADAMTATFNKIGTNLTKLRVAQ
jgi:Flp pilus assembly protein TadG